MTRKEAYSPQGKSGMGWFNGQDIGERRLGIFCQTDFSFKIDYKQILNIFWQYRIMEWLRWEGTSGDCPA